jgi:hypothetical protein
MRGYRDRVQDVGGYSVGPIRRGRAAEVWPPSYPARFLMMAGEARLLGRLGPHALVHVARQPRERGGPVRRHSSGRRG